MDFHLSSEQRQIQATARQFARDVIRKVASAYDRDAHFPRHELIRAWELGLMNGVIPKQYGGLGLSCLDICLIAEEIAYGCAGFATSSQINNFALLPLIHAGDEDQKERWLRPYVESFRLCSFAYTEAGAGSDATGLTTQATRQSGGGYRLKGAKQWITNSGEADDLVVFATVNGKPTGISAFWVPRRSPGIEVGKKEDKMGQRCSDTRSIFLDDVFVPEENRIGREGQGFAIAMQALEFSRTGAAAIAVGLAQAASDEALAYARTRKQFRRPISSFQAIQLMLADMEQLVVTSRLSVYWSAWHLDNGVRASPQASLAKCFASDAAMKVTTDAVQIFGGIGYTRDCPVEKWMRDAKLLQIYEGTNQMQRLNMAHALIGEVP